MKFFSGSNFSMRSFKRSFALSTFLMAALSISACGVLSNPDRKETPSRLMLEAQAAYDSGNFSKATELLERVIAKDAGNEEARVKLVYSYAGSIGMSPVEFIKGFATKGTSSGSNNSGGETEVTKLTENSGLPRAKIEKLRKDGQSVLTVAELRRLYQEFAVFHKAFLTVCPLFSKTTMTLLKQEATSALELIEASKCGEGRDSVSADVSVAALYISLGQFSSLWKSLLDTNSDGKFDLIETANSAKTKIENLKPDQGNVQENLKTLSDATAALTDVGARLKSEIFRLSIAQFNIIDAVIAGTDLPSEVKAPLKSGVDKVKSSLTEVNGYLDAGKTTTQATKTGDSTDQAATKAKENADKLLETASASEIENYCKQAYCFNQIYKTNKLPNKCDANKTYTCTGTTTPTP